MNALNAKISTKEANILLYRLHTGDLEREHYEKKVIKFTINRFKL